MREYIRQKLENTDEEIIAHHPWDCVPRTHPCTMHNRTAHVMRAFPQHWREDRGIMERLCPHGIGHPDPDDIKVRLTLHERVHGCDGCCCGA